MSDADPASHLNAALNLMKTLQPSMLLAGVVALSTPLQAVAQRADVQEALERRMELVREWVTREQRNINEDPSFWVRSDPVPEEVYPWENLRVYGDSVTVQVPQGGPRTHLVYHIYAPTQIRDDDVRACAAAQALHIEGLCIQQKPGLGVDQTGRSALKST